MFVGTPFLFVTITLTLFFLYINLLFIHNSYVEHKVIYLGYFHKNDLGNYISFRIVIKFIIYVFG